MSAVSANKWDPMYMVVKRRYKRDVRSNGRTRLIRKAKECNFIWEMVAAKNERRSEALTQLAGGAIPV